MTSKEIYITREIESWMKVQSKNYPIMSVMGPRQSGKTKLIRSLFPHLPYYDLEREAIFKMISKDPDQFVRDKCIDGAIFDEFHYIPKLTQILKTVSDELLTAANKEGKTALPTRFILTGSHNYLFDENIIETMTGRAAIIKLLPLTLQESDCTDVYQAMYKGGYPILYVNGQTPQTFFPPYIQNYLEREVRTIHGIGDLRTFRKFMQMCAYLSGNFFDYETVCRTLEIKKKTIDKWLNILYASHIIFFASPYYKSTMAKFANKDKMYFCDTGLCSALMDIESPLDIEEDPAAKGKLFENLVFSEVWKKSAIQGKYLDPASFWNVQGEGGYEVDMVMQKAGKIKKSIEIKAGDKFDPHWFDNMQKHPDLVAAGKFVIYTGPTMDVEGGRALNFTDLDQLFL